MLKTYEILLDVENELYSPTHSLFTISRNDFESVQLLFTIIQDDAAVDLSGATVEMAIKKPSGATVYQSVNITNASEGKAAANLTVQAYVERGIHTTEIYIRTAESMIVTPPFYFVSREAIMQTEEIESVNDWSALQQALFAYDLKPILVEGIPTEVPEYVGQMAFDILNKRVFIAGDMMVEAWQLIEGGGGGGVAAWADIIGKPETFPSSPHAHEITDVNGLQAALDAGTNVPQEPVDWTEVQNKPLTFAPEAHTHDFDSITGRPAAYPAEAHNHTIVEVTGLQAALDGKADDAELAAKADAADVYSKTQTYSKGEVYNKTEVDQMTIGEGGGSPVIVEDNLMSTSTANALSANQGRILNETKADNVHGHIIGDVTNLQSTLDSKAAAADLEGKADVAHTHSYATLTDIPTAFTPTVHTHGITDVTGLQGALNGKADDADLLGKADTIHIHAIADVTGLQTALDGKADVNHIHPEHAPVDHTHTEFALIDHDHTIADVTGLQSALDGKVDDAELNILQKRAVISGSVPALPTITPEYAGQFVIDSANKRSFIAAGTTADDWKRLAETTYVDTGDNFIMSNVLGGHKIWTGTQAAYDGLTKDAATLYFITG